MRSVVKCYAVGGRYCVHRNVAIGLHVFDSVRVVTRIFFRTIITKQFSRRAEAISKRIISSTERWERETGVTGSCVRSQIYSPFYRQRSRSKWPFAVLEHYHAFPSVTLLT